MAVIQVVVCDICKVVGKPATEYTVTRKGNDGKLETAFCLDDDPLAELWPHRRTRKLTTVAEIEASKRH